MTELCRLGELYHVDKCPMVNHSYTPFYHRILSELRNSTKVVLEIGIGNIPLMKSLTNINYKPGASLRMWRDYFPSAQIIGCDILKDVLFTEDRIATFLLDQGDSDSLRNLNDTIKLHYGEVDIIIDDGSHQEKHMTLSFLELWKIVKPNGLYIIEDIQTPFINNIINLHKSFNDAEIVYVHNGIGGKHSGKDWDCFVVFRKKIV